MNMPTFTLLAFMGLVAVAQGTEVANSDALAELRAKAERGEAAAEFRLGVIYAKGDSVAKNPVEAAKWYREAADQGHLLAQYHLGKMYDTGSGVAKDPTEAAKWYRMAAQQGDQYSQMILGRDYEIGYGVTKDPTEAVKWYRMAAEQGNAIAQGILGGIYHQGKGVPFDFAEAAKWFRLSAEQGNAYSQYFVGLAYTNGEGVIKDPVEAVRWYRKGALQGEYFSQYMLGRSFAQGVGVLKDEIEALAWYNLCAVSGDEDLLKVRDGLAIALGSEATAAAQQRSKELLKLIELNKGTKAEKGAEGRSNFATENSSPKSSGSGAIISSHGYILTAAHVVANASRVTVITAQGNMAATVVRVDESNDLAVLKIADSVYTALPIASSRHIRLGQIVATIGFPNPSIQGFSPKLTRGEISSLNGVEDDPRSWQISVPVQPGNSGGPLLDEDGNLIGVVLAKLGLAAAKATNDLPQNVGYAVKSAYALALLEPYLDDNALEPIQPSQKPSFEDMVAKAQKSVVLILVY